MNSLRKTKTTAAVGFCLFCLLLAGCQFRQQLHPTPDHPTTTVSPAGSKTEEPRETVTITPTPILTPTGTPERTEAAATPKITMTPSPTPETVLDRYTRYTSKKLETDILALSRSYSDILSYEIIGRSNWGASLYAIKLGTGSQKILVTAGIHARENITTNYLMRCAEEFAKAYRNREKLDGCDVRAILNTVTFYFVPLCNPDGADIVNLLADPTGVAAKEKDKVIWKANGRGVDLNRNFPFYWEEMASSNETPDTPADMNYPGKQPASEPETQALIALCNGNEFVYCLNLHTKGKVFYWRDVGNGTVPGDKKLVDLLAARTGYKKVSISTDVVGFGGGFENWFRYAFQRPAICVELTTFDTDEGYYNKFLPYNLVNRKDYGVAMYDIYSKTVLDWSNTRSMLLYTAREYLS